MHLDKHALRFASEQFEAFDEGTLSFVPTNFKGRVLLVDLSTINLRERDLRHSPESVFPDSLTLRSKHTGEVYILGQRLGDARPDLGHYYDTTKAHLVTDEGEGSPSGLAKIHRRVPKGPADDPGWLVSEVVGEHYTDTTFISGSDEENAHQLSILSFTAHFRQGVEVKRQDFIELHGRFFRATDQYAQDGFRMVRMDEEPDTRIDFVVKKQDVKRYDEDLMRYVTDTVSYNVTGEIVVGYDIGSWTSESQSYIDVVVDSGHIGFKPEAGLIIEIEGRERTVRRVSTQPGEKQYRLRCY